MLTIGIQPDVLATAPNLEACLEGWASLRVDPELHGVDAVIIRSDTRVDDRFLEARPSVRWVSSATSGHDHLDDQATARRGIRWTSAPGCNAEAVADWCILAVERLWRGPPGIAGIIGVGNVGRATTARLRRSGWRVLGCDPPRAARDDRFSHTPLSELLERSDLISLHVPLDAGTAGLFDQAAFDAFKREGVVLNAARGGVMDETAALGWIADGGTLAIDVFAAEPHPDPAVVQRAAWATPHIAGHTAWAKAEGVRRCLAWLATQIGHELASDTVGVAPCDLEPRKALDMANRRLKDGENFTVVRASSVRRRLMDPATLDP